MRADRRIVLPAALEVGVLADESAQATRHCLDRLQLRRARRASDEVRVDEAHRRVGARSRDDLGLTGARVRPGRSAGTGYRLAATEWGGTPSPGTRSVSASVKPCGPR